MARGHKIDLSGHRFGRLHVVRFDQPSSGGRSTFACLCDCGNSIVVKAGNLVRGSTRSCGCLRREKSAERKRTHGQTRSPTYLTWVSMLQRCENPEAKGYEYYGGRGVTVCEAWHSYENFVADMGQRPKGRTLDRENPYGNYERGNCRWATPAEQAANKRGYDL